ncbi:phosphotransferase [Frankia nepalensis]|uniref:phosphotransferase n=1 Tax=Frankia nepalensis TaxID=1836974 RepID=UPI001932F2AC|nr:phosphotransferase [Frankia nepalensis]
MDATPAHPVTAGPRASASPETGSRVPAPDPEPALTHGLAALAARLAAPGETPRPGGETRPATGGAIEVLSQRHDRLVVRRGGLVLKAHPPGTDPAALAERLRAAADPLLASALLAPLPIPGAELAGYATRVADRWVSAWPLGGALGPADTETAPWEEAAEVLARLHTAPYPAAMTTIAAHPRRRLGPAIAALTLATPGPDTASTRNAAPTTNTGPASTAPAVPLPAGPAGSDGALATTATAGTARDAVLAAYRALPGRKATSTAWPGRPRTLIHGDWHLGQLVQTAVGGWRLIDIDDLGVGDPAWDLARPAAWFAAGLLPPEVWARFVDAYRAAGGPALPGEGDPWPAVDLPARTFVVEFAARALTTSWPAPAAGDAPDRPDQQADEDGEDSKGDQERVGDAFVACCRQMVATRATDR